MDNPDQIWEEPVIFTSDFVYINDGTSYNESDEMLWANEFSSGNC